MTDTLVDVNDYEPRQLSGRQDVISRLILGLLPLLLAAGLGFVASAMLLMATDSCMADPAPGICATTTQQWVLWLPVIGAGLGLATGSCLGVLLVRRQQSTTPALTLAWLMFAVAEFAVLVLLRS